jgi:hypothetical protein
MLEAGRGRVRSTSTRVWGGEMNEPKVIGLAGVGLQVPDLAVAESFYGAFGLTAEKRGSALGLRSPGRSAGVTRVQPGIPIQQCDLDAMIFSIEFETDAGRRKIFILMNICHLSGDRAPRVCSVSGR